jgi:hypothetical protein
MKKSNLQWQIAKQADMNCKKESSHFFFHINYALEAEYGLHKTDISLIEGFKINSI